MSTATQDFRARRLQRRLEDLERTNPTDIPASSFVPQTSSGAPTPSSAPALAGTPGAAPAPAKKKQSVNVRRVLYAKKSLRDWVAELPANPPPPYTLAAAPPPSTPPRRICASCGAPGAYSCPRCGESSCDRSCVDVHARDGGCGVGM